MKVADLIAVLSNLPSDTIVRVFSAEAQDWMPINDIDHCLVLGVGERIDLRAYPVDDEDDEDDDTPKVGAREACALCGQDIEWTGDDWRDRGGNRGCVPYEERGEIVTPPAGAKHAPTNAADAGTIPHADQSNRHP